MQQRFSLSAGRYVWSRKHARIIDDKTFVFNAKDITTPYIAQIRTELKLYKITTFIELVDRTK